MKKSGRITDQTVEAKKAAFLRVFEDTASVTRACKIVGINRERHYTWQKEDPEYKAKFAVALDRAADSLEDEAVRRAKRGVSKPVIYKGQMQYEVVRDENGAPVMLPGTDEPKIRPLVLREYSDTLLIFLLKGMRPDKYRDNWKGEISGPNGGPIELTSEALKNLSDDELANLIALTRKLASPGSDGGGTPPAAAE
jgi:hypothetical protein